MQQTSVSSLQQLQNDIIKTAQLLDAPYDEAKIDRLLTVYAQNFQNAPVEFRATNKPTGQYTTSFRYVDLEQPHDPLQMALDNDLLPANSERCADLVRALSANFSILGWGVDGGTNTGMEKIWVFFDYRYPITDFYDLPQIPAAVKKTAEYHQAFDLQSVTIVAADFAHNTMNLYSVFPQALTGNPAYNPAQIAEMIDRVNGQQPDDELRGMVANTPIVNITYNWDSDDIQRLCYYLPAFTPDAIPPGMDRMYDVFANDVPFIADNKAYILGYAFGQGGSYLKIENDYNGRMLNMFQTAATVPPKPTA